MGGSPTISRWRTKQRNSRPGRISHHFRSTSASAGRQPRTLPSPATAGVCCCCPSDSVLELVGPPAPLLQPSYAWHTSWAMRSELCNSSSTYDHSSRSQNTSQGI